MSANFVQNFSSISQEMIKLQPLKKTNIVFRKMYSYQEMLDYINGNAQKKLFGVETVC